MKDTIKNGEVFNGLAANLSVEIFKDGTFLTIKIYFGELDNVMKYGRNIIKNPNAFKKSTSSIYILK